MGRKKDKVFLLFSQFPGTARSLCSLHLGEQGETTEPLRAWGHLFQQPVLLQLPLMLVHSSPSVPLFSPDLGLHSFYDRVRGNQQPKLPSLVEML